MYVQRYVYMYVVCGFWRYAHFTNMPFFFRVSRKGRSGGGGSLNLVSYSICTCTCTVQCTIVCNLCSVSIHLHVYMHVCSHITSFLHSGVFIYIVFICTCTCTCILHYHYIDCVVHVATCTTSKSLQND